MSPQTETKASVGFKAGVKEYKLTYYTPEYQTKDTDILAAFRVTQPEFHLKKQGSAVAAESSTGTWTTVWTDGSLPVLIVTAGDATIERVVGEKDQYIAYKNHGIHFRCQRKSVTYVWWRSYSLWYRSRCLLPVASGGIHVWHMPALTEIFGDDSVLQFGGRNLGHPWGNAPGAAVNRVALEACVKVNGRT
ncbi:hypothetical protein HAX54_015772 [Datura stramonium]|uniref:Ribulose bisphosphate carboxylase large chain n=1 Tax=Datura stramonium TaxID=4076 RepID=A0ABS8UJW8_DATST|nr:hypothetical protein [Datura stramonium]